MQSDLNPLPHNDDLMHCRKKPFENVGKEDNAFFSFPKMFSVL